MKHLGLTAVAFLVALAGSTVLAFASVVALPIWLLLAALAAVLLGCFAAFVMVWQDARATGKGLVRTTGRAVWESFRLLLRLLFA